jgi:hypothetical protein
MRAESRDLLETFLTYQEYHLNEAKRSWETAWDRIRKIPNTSNPMGIWQREQLEDFRVLHILILERDRVVRELRDYIHKPKSRFQRPQKVSKTRKKKPARL